MPDHLDRSALDLTAEVWSRRKWLGIIVFAAVFTTVASVAKFLPNIYRSTATVLVERHQVPETFVRSLVTGELDTRLQTISQEILSRARLKDLITRFDLYQESRRRAALEEVVEKMRRDIQLELTGAPQTSGRTATVAFNLSYRGRNPETVAGVTNTLASFYVEENLRLRAQQAAGTAEVLSAQLADMKNRLDEQERRVKDFRMRSIGELPQQMTVNMATLERLHAQLHLNSANHLRAMDRRAALEKQLAEVDPGGMAASDAAAAQIAKLRRELRELQSRFSHKYPDVIRLKLEIATLEQQFADPKPDRPAEPAPASSTDPTVARARAALRQADAEIKALQAEEQSLRRDIAAYQRRLESTPQREQELHELSRDYETTKDLYHSLLKRHEDAKLAENMEQRQRGEQFRILDSAIPATEPAGPNRMLLLFMGLMVSVAIAAGSMVLAERVDTSFHTIDSLRALTDVPVLVSIPLIVTEADKRRRRWRFCLATATGMAVLGLIIKASQYIATGNEQLVGMMMRGGS